MAVSLKTGFCVPGSKEVGSNKERNSGFCLKSGFKGTQLVVSDQRVFADLGFKIPQKLGVYAQTSLCVSRAMRWWEKTLKPNIVEINSAQELVDSLLNAGDKLVIIDFYSPGCGGCRALHPKICQLAELNPTAIFLKVNYEELKSMCYSLNIHVLPFFRIYRGAEGRLCSFSCTNATIKKFKDALAKYGTERCSLGPAKGLEESEILKLVSNGEISIDFSSRSTTEAMMEDLILTNTNIFNPSSTEVFAGNAVFAV
ncbi:hypothetical protein GIB67_011976 [Kingdonia uniflora]|uniref:Thioredoxin domain-containing protein n=1 Tax=Kingdonia uniflora TaxID=39325 RepID=A0A7J7LZZ7_9MAGN|nr:hypothetical protein GIB67_011976 [Kingdonia uniflora]